MNIEKILSLISRAKAGKSINWSSLKKSLLKLGVNDDVLTKAFEVTRYSDNIYGVEVVDNSALDDILKLINQRQPENRSQASRLGNTHSKAVDGALLVVRTCDTPCPHNHLFGTGNNIPTPHKKHALLIENLECFLEYESVYKFITDNCGVTINSDDIEFIWAAGNSISNRLIIPYLDKFNGKVMCLFDVDLGGLKIYSNLLRAGLLPEHTPFLIPRDLNNRLAASSRGADDESLDKLSSVYGITPTTDKVISLIRHHKRTLEQESYRADF